MWEGVSPGIAKYLEKPSGSQHNFTERKHQKTTGKESKEASEMQTSILDHLETKKWGRSNLDYQR